jgi:hypothetical protein
MTDSKLSFSKTIFGQKLSFVKTTFMSDFKKIYLKQKTTFTCFLNLRKIWTKDDFKSEVVFLKNDFHGKNRL